LALPLVGAVVGVTGKAIESITDVLKHRRENPDLGKKKNNVTQNGLFNINLSKSENDPEKGQTELGTNVTKGMALGVGLGMGIAGATWLVGKLVEKANSQRSREVEQDVDVGGHVIGGKKVILGVCT